MEFEIRHKNADDVLYTAEINYKPNTSQSWKLRLAVLQALKSNASLENADLSEADLSNADLPGARLTNANLTGANLTGANLTGTNLTRANLSYANLTDANLMNLTEWEDAILADVNLTGAKLF